MFYIIYEKIIINKSAIDKKNFPLKKAGFVDMFVLTFVTNRFVKSLIDKIKVGIFVLKC